MMTYKKIITIVLLLAIVAIPAATFGDSLVGHWTMDDNAANTTVADSTANNYHGTFSDSTNPNTDYHHSADCQEGTGSLYFDGTDDYVTMPRSSVLEVGHASTHQLATSVWIKSDYTSSPPTDFTTIVGTGDGGWFLGSFPNNTYLVFVCWLSSGVTAIVTDNTGVFDGQWHHVTGVFDGSSVHLYVDDNHGEVGTSGGTIRNMFSAPVLISENDRENGRYWDGLIDDLKIYDYALSSEEIYHMANPNYAWNPSPVDDASAVAADANLSWSAGAKAVSHNVYFGTDESAVESADTDLPGDITGNGCVNYLDLKVLNSQWLATPGSPSADLDGDGDVNFADYAIFANNWMQSGSSSPLFMGNQSGTIFDPGTLAGEEIYYWRIDEVNETEPDSPWTGRVWNFTTSVVTGRQTLYESTTGRRYILYVPTDYDAEKSYPLIISSHGTAQNGDTEMDDTGPNGGFDNGTPTWPTLAEGNDVIVACPDMTGAYGESGCAVSSTHLTQLASDDTAIMAIISEIEGTYNINASNIMLTGFSGGGNVVHYVGLRHPAVFVCTCARHGNFHEDETPSPLPSGATDMPVYIFTGSGDSVCGPPESITWYTAQGFNYLDTDTFTTYPSSVHTTDRHHAFNWFLDIIKPRVIVSTDIGGSDNDDYQSMVHYLVYADKFDTEGLISSPPHAGRKANILEVIDEYVTDYNNLNSHASFPTPQSLRDVTKQGAINASPSAGYSSATDGSNLIVSRANVSDHRPLWILVWGSITDVAQAVHDDPGIKSKIRVYSIGSWNTDQDVYARNYLYNNHSDMWWIENDSTFRGMFTGGDQSGDLGNYTFVATHVRYHGALGDFYYAKKTDLKMGDTPSVLYLLNGNPDTPTTSSWGGMFGTTGHGTYFWTDLTDPLYQEGSYDGAKTVNMHREAYLRDWQSRMDWADAP